MGVCGFWPARGLNKQHIKINCQKPDSTISNKLSQNNVRVGHTYNGNKLSRLLQHSPKSCKAVHHKGTNHQPGNIDNGIVDSDMRKGANLISGYFWQ